MKNVYEYFKNLPDANLQCLKELQPITEYQKELIEEFKPPIELFVDSFFEKMKFENKESIEIKNEILFNDFLEYIENSKIKYECSSIQFHVRLNRYKTQNLTKNKQNSRIIDDKRIKSGRYKIFKINKTMDNYLLE